MLTYSMFYIVCKQNKISLDYYNPQKMNKCQHNLPINQFCISQHCQWKQPGGCQQCIKKYHTHYRQQKLISELQLTQYMKIFSSSESSHKPNCRNIQQAFYTYFNQLKNQLTQVIDLLCKTVINFIGTPYLMQNKLFNCFKRIKNKQYRRLNQKDINKFCQVAKNASSNTIIKQQSKLYKEQLKKFDKLVQNLQSLTLSYQDLLCQANLTYKHQKSYFENLSSLLKQNLQITDPSISISLFHQKSLQKNKIDKSQKTERSQYSGGLRSFNSQQYEKNKSKHSEINIPSFYSGILPNREKQSKSIRTQNSLIGSQSKRESSICKDTSPHKNGLRDFNELQKKQNNKQTINTINLKRPSSLQRNMSSNNKKTIPEMFIGKNNKVKNQFKIDEYDEFIYPQVQKQKIHMVDNYSRKKSQGIAEIFGTENTSTFFTSQQSKRTDSFLETRQKRQLSQKQADINYKKQKLIEMMKTYQFSKKSSDPIQVQNLSSISSKNYSKDTMTKQTKKKDCKQLKNNSVVVNSMTNSSQTFSKQIKLKNNMSLVVENKDIKKKFNIQRKLSYNENPNAYFNNIQIEQINPINECISQSFQIGSLQALKQLIPENNMNGGLSQLPLQQQQEKPKVMACSRLIIVPTSQKFPDDYACDSPLIKKRKVTFKASPQKVQNKRTVQKSSLKVQKKQSISSTNSLQKQEMTESQQKSLSLLIKSIGQKPQQAIQTLESSLKQSPNNLSAAEYLSFLYLQCQKPRQVLTVCNKILQRFEIVSKENEQLLINLQINKSAALNMLGRYSQAIVLLLKCMKIKQTDCLFKNFADAYYFSSDYEKAISYYEKTVRLSPNHDQAYHNMAVCLYLQQNYQLANHALQRAIELAPKNVEYLEFRKHIQQRLIEKIR